MTINSNDLYLLNFSAPTTPVKAISEKIDVSNISPLNFPYGKICALSNSIVPQICLTYTTGPTSANAPVIRIRSLIMVTDEANLVMFLLSPSAIHR